MTTIAQKRRGDRAMDPADHADYALFSWFRCYRYDPHFCAALESLATEHHDDFLLVMDDGWYQRYTARNVVDPRAERCITAVQQFECAWLLDLLSNGRGDTAIWEWMKARFQRVSFPDWLNVPQDDDWPPQFFGNAAAVRFRNNAEPDIERAEDGQPIVRLGARSWDPRTEGPAEARARLMRESQKQIAAEMDRIARAYEECGWVMEDTKDASHQYPGWAYRRWVKREHFSAIADSAGVAPESVRLRTNEFAKRIGFEFPRTRLREL